jgi:oxygen-independent coproporphyrinogen III oxidase
MVDFMGETANDNSGTSAVRHFYVHIPFCARICPYCAFYKERANPAEAGRFCEAILTELSAASRERSLCPETIFFGGGTPTALTTSQLERLLQGFHERLDLSALREWTFEANPGSVSERKAELLKRFGVNRISLGVQSFDESLLELLGREHSSAQAEATFHLLRAAGFTNLSIDLMFGLPGQTLAQWEATLERALALRPDHISTYCLTYEEDTEFLQRYERGEFSSDPEIDAEFYTLADESLGRAGFEHYEVSNYAARPGFQSIHNRAYWAGLDYLGFGPSAVSTIGFRRWKNLPDYRAYAARILRGESVTMEEEILTPEMKRTEAIALSLRTNEGAHAEWLAHRPHEIREFIRLGLMRAVGERYVLTPAGRFLADSVAEAFI